MRKKWFMITLVLVLALTIALPIQAMGSVTCGGERVKTVYYTYKIITSNGSNCSNNQGSSTAVAKYKDYSSKVFEVETMLSKLGYDVGVVSKFFDYNTLLAVKKFQQANNLPGTGVVDQATYNKLKEKYSKLGSGNNDEPGNQTPPKEPDPPNNPNPGTPGGNGGNTGGNNGGNNGGTAPISGLTAQEQQMINLVNQERTSRGLPALKVDMTLVKTARMKSQDMIDKNYFAHQSPTYGSPFDLMKSQGVSYRYAGENLAGAGSVTSAHTNLMNSSGHRANILNPNFTHIGIGIVDGGRYGKMFTQHFVGR